MTEAAPIPVLEPQPARRYQPLAPAAAAFVVGVLAGEYAGGGMAAWCAAALAAARASGHSW